MDDGRSLQSSTRELSIWWFAFGYFATYAPYSALTKALSKGALPGMAGPIDGFVLLPSAVMASTVGMFAFLTAMGWWRYATQRQLHIRGRTVSVPSPRWRTLLSGTCTATIVVTTTLAYTFEGISIVFAMLLMRGGVLVVAPVVDALSRRKVRWYSWLALLLSLAALIVAFAEKGGFRLTTGAAIDIALYLAAYFIRLRVMSGAAKSKDTDDNRRYFVEEQMVATPLVMVVLALWAAGGSSSEAAMLREGFFGVWGSPLVLVLLLVGLFSQGTGVFGGLILLDKRENTFCVPVNRASSVLAGLVATFGMVILLGARPPSGLELVGAGLIIAAILVLSIPPLLEKRPR
jgi:drug/metabolite transporter (DMT)-like permease